jgi:hypothetical protein
VSAKLESVLAWASKTSSTGEFQKKHGDVCAQKREDEARRTTERVAGEKSRQNAKIVHCDGKNLPGIKQNGGMCAVF